MKVVGVTVMMMMTESAMGIEVGWWGFGVAEPQSQFIEAFLSLKKEELNPNIQPSNKKTKSILSLDSKGC